MPDKTFDFWIRLSRFSIFQNKARKQRGKNRLFRDFLPKWGPGTTFFLDFDPIFEIFKIAPKMVPRSHFSKKVIFLRNLLFWQKVHFFQKMDFSSKSSFLSKMAKNAVFWARPKISRNLGKFPKYLRKGSCHFFEFCLFSHCKFMNRIIYIKMCLFSSLILGPLLFFVIFL